MIFFCYEKKAFPYIFNVILKFRSIYFTENINGWCFRVSFGKWYRRVLRKHYWKYLRGNSIGNSIEKYFIDNISKKLSGNSIWNTFAKFLKILSGNISKKYFGEIASRNSIEKYFWGIVSEIISKNSWKNLWGNTIEK